MLDAGNTWPILILPQQKTEAGISTPNNTLAHVRHPLMAFFVPALWRVGVGDLRIGGLAFVSRSTNSCQPVAIRLVPLSDGVFNCYTKVSLMSDLFTPNMYSASKGLIDSFKVVRQIEETDPVLAERLERNLHEINKELVCRILKVVAS